jgi:hypothetical protein
MYYNLVHMEPRFQTSFIPKKTVGGDFERAVAKDDTNIFTLTATILFLATALVYGGLFGYRMVLIRQITEADTAISDARTAIQPEKIKELIDANSRIKASVNLLQSHLVTTNLLKLLADNTVKKMLFTSLIYKYEMGVPTVSIKSEVATYNAFAVQQDVFSKNELIKQPKFQSITLADNGNIKFEIFARVDSSVTSYKKLIESVSTPQ